MGQYVIIENGGRYCYNLCASNGHVLVNSIVFPSRDECLKSIDEMRDTASTAGIEDSTEDAFDRIPSPKYRIYETMDEKYFFRFITSMAGDVARSHEYPKKESLLRRIERMRSECDSSLAHEE